MGRGLTGSRRLAAAVRDGAFGGGLHGRTAKVTVHRPPLRRRREDLLPLRLRALGEPAPALRVDRVEALLHHAFPYNVRELFKLAAQLRHLGEGGPLHRELLGDRLPPAPSASPAAPEKELPAGDELRRLLAEHGGTVALARHLGCSRFQLHRWMRRQGVDPRRG